MVSLAFKTETEAKTMMDEVEALLDEAGDVKKWTSSGMTLAASEFRLEKHKYADVKKIVKELHKIATDTGKYFELIKQLHVSRGPGYSKRDHKSMDEATTKMRELEKIMISDKKELEHIVEMIAALKAWDKKITTTGTAIYSTTVDMDKMLDKMEAIVETINHHLTAGYSEVEAKVVA